MAWAMPANWRADCHAARAAACRRGTAGSSRRDREAAVREPTPHCATLYSALKRLTSEECQREKNKGVKRGTSGTNAQCVLATAPGSKADAQPRSENLEREA